ncbi:hypothetical protein E9993_14800 [Labilibacter sediminis]|nr:hypothetical protein E9993_14800 [Labilibacter sediminis]
MSENKQQPLHKAGRSYVKKLIRMRRHLIKEGVNNYQHAHEVVERLDKLLNFWPYDTPRKMAYFVHNHSAEILYLIPGPNCRAHNSLTAEFNSLLSQSQQLLHHESIC